MIERFTTHPYKNHLVPSPTGQWVRYEDHLKLMKEKDTETPAPAPVDTQSGQ